MTEAQQIALTIMNQLGGKRFGAMTGAKNFVALTDGGVSFRIPTGFSQINGKKTGINAVTIKLDHARDVYDMEFASIRGAKITPKGEARGIYCDMLASTFTEHTGLDTRLF